MNTAEFSNALGKVNDKYIMEAVTYERKKKSGWLKWGAMAACFGLILIVGIVVLKESCSIVLPPNSAPNIPGGGNIPGEQHGGVHSDGVDPIIESLAVYPATEDIHDVENATIESIDEITAYGLSGLGNYLPTELPSGYHFDKASLYETTMKDGTKYHMLRVTYTTGSDSSLPNSVDEDGGVLAPAPNSLGESFAVFVMDYEPKTKKTIYHFVDLPSYLETKSDSNVFHFSYGDVFIGVSPNCLSAEEILFVVKSIPHIPDRGSEPAEYPDTTIIPEFDLDKPCEPGMS